ncbi:MerR family transcriptional regulator [Cohnella fermenti]|uniref:MerR family transcriptional regulator n=1 Tax=Cohnella fermenti TaxID=2565925 RepID=A0A4S4C7G9_9BACL|nr:MerR family transcriptional regulator [Cohnella fermenti]THF81727.1 MerR family transcriptional regulator [Cohnella fermenti]
MEYTIQKLARMAGVSTRTLRYYDEIGLLKPARLTSSGYRIYGGHELERLQHILFYRELEVDLDTIARIVNADGFDGASALYEHREKLLDRRRRLDVLLDNVEKTIALAEGRGTMSDAERFEGFKERMIEENEAKYGEEIRRKYGEKAVEESNKKLRGMTKEQHEEAARLAEEIHAALAEAYATGDPASAEAQRVAELHKRWLAFYWAEYSKEAHAGLARMYVEDERFRAYYDKQTPGSAEFLRDSIVIFTGQG